MTDTLELFHRAEEDLVRSAEISPSTCDELGKRSPGAIGLLRNAMTVAACGSQKSNGSERVGEPTHVPDEGERVAAIRLLLIKLKLHTESPAWSSDILRRAVDGVLAVSGGTIDDLFRALLSVFADYPVELTEPRANFIKDVVVECFTRHRLAYNSIDWEDFCARLGENASRSQLYLALLAIPPGCLPARLATAITAGLVNTPYQDEAFALADASGS